MINGKGPAPVSGIETSTGKSVVPNTRSCRAIISVLVSAKDTLAKHDPKTNDRVKTTFFMRVE
jgi:hypothetical protein